MMITSADLSWWLDLASTLEWTFAKTMPGCPHSYVVESRSPLTHDDFVRAARVIHTFGQPGKFYERTSIYLTSPGGDLKWWSMDRVLADTNLINQAATERTYGPQNAPSTASAHATPYDGIAVTYDANSWWPNAIAESAQIRRLLDSAGYATGDTVLDVGAGTGRVFDTMVVRPEQCTVVDPSSPMLNELVRKHPGVAAVHADTADGFLADAPSATFGVVTAAGGSGSHLTPSDIESLASRAKRAMVVSHFKPKGEPLYLRGGRLPQVSEDSRDHAARLAIASGGEVLEAGGVQLALIRPAH